MSGEAAPGQSWELYATYADPLIGFESMGATTGRSGGGFRTPQNLDGSPTFYVAFWWG